MPNGRIRKQMARMKGLLALIAAVLSLALGTCGVAQAATAVAVPASAAAQPGTRAQPAENVTTMLLTPAPAIARQNPAGCSTHAGAPRKSHGKAEATGTQKCARTVAAMAIRVCLYRNGHQAACTTKTVNHRTRGIAATVSKRCRNNRHGSFFSRARADYLYRGHIYVSQVAQSRTVTLACGF
jgi:hypothetical protein